MSHSSLQPTLPAPTLDGTGAQVPLLLVAGHNLLWGATFEFPAPIYSRDKTRLLTGLFAFFALLRVAIRDACLALPPRSSWCSTVSTAR